MAHSSLSSQGRSAFYYKQGVQVSGGKVSVDLHWHGIPPCTAIVFMQEPVGGGVVLVWVSRVVSPGAKNWISAIPP